MFRFKDLKEIEREQINNKFDLDLFNVRPIDSGRYRCQAENYLGMAFTAIEVEVVCKYYNPEINEQFIEKKMLQILKELGFYVRLHASSKSGRTFGGQ